MEATGGVPRISTARHARRRYPAARTNLTDAQQAVLAPPVPGAKPGGRPARHERRLVADAILPVRRSGETRRLLPRDLPPWQVVSHDFLL